MVGSHFPPENYYPENFAPFKGVIDAETKGVPHEKIERRNHYDNATAFSDKVICEILETLKAENQPSFLYYISDHGESPRADNWRCFTDNDVWEIPMFVWFSPKYKELYPEVITSAKKTLDVPLQSDKLFPSLLSVARCKTNIFSDEEDIFSGKYHPVKTPRMIQDGKVKYSPEKR